MKNYNPKIYYRSSPRKDEPCLLAWEDFFKKEKINYSTDRRFSIPKLNNKISIIFGSWKDNNKPHHKLKRQIIASNQNFIVNETSLLGRKKITENFEENWFRIGINGFLADEGIFNNKNLKENRWDMIQKARSIELLPWSNSGRYILIVLQLPNDASLRGENITKWAYSICKKIRSKTNFPILIRKPQLKREFDDFFLKKILKLKNIDIQEGSRENLFETIDNSTFVCTFSSGMGIDSILRGKPVVVSSKGSFVYPVRTKLQNALNGDFFTPDRHTILNQISFCQWNIQEIREGLVWNHLKSELGLKK